MTELALRDSADLAPPFTADPTGGRLVAWAEGLAAAHRIGTALCQTAFAPQSFRGKPEEAAAAILYGDEIGFTPTQALQNIHVISGKPGLYARAMVALLLSHGHEVWTVEKSDSRVTVAGRRKGSHHVHEETWTTARAQKAGYTSNKKYTTDPQAMLYARAAADVCRQAAPDALAGLAYSIEEMEMADTPTTSVTRRTEPKTTAQRKPAPTPVEPELDEPQVTVEQMPTPEPEPETPPEATAPAPDAKPMTKRTRGQMFALFSQKGVAEDLQLAGINYRTGREYTSRGDVTEDDALKVIEYLKTLPDAEVSSDPEQEDQR